MWDKKKVVKKFQLSNLDERLDSCPVWLADFLPLDDVMRDTRATIVFWMLPSQTTGVLRDVGDLEWSETRAWHSWYTRHNRRDS